MNSSFTRRDWLWWSSVSGISLAAGCSQQAAVVPTVAVPAKPPSAAFDQLLQFPGKVPMRAINDRPPCLETPWEYFKHDLTPNEAFYVRWHLQSIPEVKLENWRLKVGGHVEKPLELTMDQLRKMPAHSVVAVNQCSGNSRGLFQPAVPGAQWTNGAMGNARWTGVKLADVLKQAGLRAGAVDVTFKGMDKAGHLDKDKKETVPDFIKSLPVDDARNENVILAYEMNGAPLPYLNGFPMRLVVPGWFATYWVKGLEEIGVLPAKYEGYWMAKAYRIPKPGLVDKPGELAKETVPINRMSVRSFFVTPLPGKVAVASMGQPLNLEGIAFDGGSGIKKVEISEDGGKGWKAAQLGQDLGPFSFRRWNLSWTPGRAGEYRLLVRATSQAGVEQPLEVGWNRAGYLRNHAEAVQIKVG